MDSTEARYALFVCWRRFSEAALDSDKALVNSSLSFTNSAGTAGGVAETTLSWPSAKGDRTRNKTISAELIRAQPHHCEGICFILFFAPSWGPTDGLCRQDN